ncbi:MAG: zinc ribbon domain-containing protein [Methanomassiliicoccales archaeon]|nr:zinc ribbon domain-containing protein [Methanomassiliicoccales archaeon]
MPGIHEDASDEDIFEFDCPECGAHIVGEVTKCPKCGTEFVIEEVEDVPTAECPHCHAAVPMELRSCPTCGKTLIQDDQEELRQEFPLLVAEVKPLLIISKDYEVEVGEGRRLIDKAVRAGKQRDLAKAVQMVKEAGTSIKAALEIRMESDLRNLERLAEVTQRSGVDPGEIKEAIATMVKMREVGDIEGVLQAATKGRKAADRLAGKYMEATDMTMALSHIIEVCDRFYLDVREARRMLREAEDAGEKGDWNMMGILARKGREQLVKTLPEASKTEMRKAKNQLLDAKAEGKDVRGLVKILKDAGVAMNRERFDQALDLLSDFKAELIRI